MKLGFNVKDDYDSGIIFVRNKIIQCKGYWNTEKRSNSVINFLSSFSIGCTDK